MSFDDGWAALHLDMPPRVPRTEYSAEQHDALVRAVTGRNPDEGPAARRDAVRAFRTAWNYDLVWRTLLHGQPFGILRTDMGHAAYAADGADFRPAGRCPFRTPEDALAFDPADAFGPADTRAWRARFEADYREACAAQPDAVNMTGIYTTLMSGLIAILGWDMLLMSAGTDLEAFGGLADRYGRWIRSYVEALAAADVPVVMIHDDLVWTEGPFLPPAWYRAWYFPALRRLLEPLAGSGKRVLFTCDGSFTLFIDDLAACGVHGFVLEPATDMARIAARYGRTHVFIGNADTRALLDGPRSRIRAEVERCMAIGKDCPGFFMAVGNHIPPNTPVEHARYYQEVYAELAPRGPNRVTTGRV
jgi:hypothetical protein